MKNKEKKIQKFSLRVEEQKEMAGVSIIMSDCEIKIKKIHDLGDPDLFHNLGYADGPKRSVYFTDSPESERSLYHELGHMFVWLTYGTMAPKLDGEGLAQLLANFTIMLESNKDELFSIINVNKMK